MKNNLAIWTHCLRDNLFPESMIIPWLSGFNPKQKLGSRCATVGSADCIQRLVILMLIFHYSELPISIIKPIATGLITSVGSYVYLMQTIPGCILDGLYLVPICTKFTLERRWSVCHSINRVNIVPSRSPPLLDSNYSFLSSLATTLLHYCATNKTLGSLLNFLLIDFVPKWYFLLVYLNDFIYPFDAVFILNKIQLKICKF